jgi:hypothetical protein
MNCGTYQWSTTNSLCISGNVPPVTPCSGGTATTTTTNGSVTVTCGPTETTSFDYGEDWGAIVGVESTGCAGGTLSIEPTSITVNFTGTPTGSGGILLGVVIGGIQYCVEQYESGQTLTAANLTEQCWNIGGASPASLAGISKVQLEITSGAGGFSFTDFCMTGITFQ